MTRESNPGKAHNSLRIPWVSQRKYTDREGVGRTSVEVIANDMKMLSPKPASSGVEEGENYDPFLPDFPEDAS